MSSLSYHASPLHVWCLAAVLCLGLASLGRGEVEFRPQTVDRGEVLVGPPLIQEFHCYNHGPEDVELLEARSSCGCLRPELPRQPLAPGGSALLRLQVNTLTQAEGQHTWQVQIFYRCGPRLQETTLQLTARIRAEIVLVPARLTLFLGDDPLRQEVVLVDRRPQPLRELHPVSSCRALRVHTDPPERDATGQTLFRIHLEVTPDGPPGSHEEVVHLYTSDPLYYHLQIPVTLHRAPRQRLRVLPAEVTLHAAAGQPFPLTWLRVADAAGEPVVLEGVAATHPALICRWASGPEHLASVRLQVDPQRCPSAASWDAELHIQVSRPFSQTLRVPVHLQRD